jgi:FkbM family methyltransferase
MSKKGCKESDNDTEFEFTNFSILLPADHLLPTYRKEHKLYDRFLPHISRYLETNSTVVDVGANCGDTVAAMYDTNKNLTYICIEPDELFFDYLQKNVLRIKEIDKDAKIQTIKSLVGKNINVISLEGSGGTKKAIVGENEKTISSQPLDDILSFNKIFNIRLLKSDVDGFDYDVIDSAESNIRSYLPIIFFECQFDHFFQKKGFRETIGNLCLQGYTDWIIFDNFGEVVLRTGDIQQIFQLFEYIWRQNIKRSTRTIFYYDVLTFTKKDNILINKVINDYISSN